MEQPQQQPNDNTTTSHLPSSYYHHHLSTATPPLPSTNNGVLVNNNSNNDGGATATATPAVVYPHSVAVQASPALDASGGVTKRKRGRPRKYGNPEQALGAEKIPTSTQQVSHSNKKRDFVASSSASNKKSHQLSSLGNAGHAFTPHIVSVKAGEDVAQKMMSFMGESKRELCILSASGSISNATLRQPATYGGGITYEGRFEIISLSGSYIHTELGGKSGALSVCLSNTDGSIIGGGVSGPLVAAGPVQVIVGTFVMDTKKDVGSGIKLEVSGSQFQSPVGAISMSSGGYRPTVEPADRFQIQSEDDHQNYGGSHFMIQNRGIHTAPPQSATDWRSGHDNRSSGSFDFTGRGGHLTHQSPENGDYEQFPD